MSACMPVALVPALRAQREALDRLAQLYVYDFSEALGLEIDDDGRFAADPLRGLWDDPRRRPFFVRVGDRLAGFAVVQRGSRLSGAPDGWDMAEFFIVRRQRRPAARGGITAGAARG